MRFSSRRLVLLIAVLAAFAVSPGPTRAEDIQLTLRHRVETAEGSGRYHTLTRQEAWDAAKTAIIVCDMWDLHHSPSAMRREGEFAPRLEQVLTTAREQGVTIIHAPSDCMDFYEGHAARQRAKAAPAAANLPKQIGEWCHRIPAEERSKYPIDQSDGGEDDDPAELAGWAAKLEEMGRNPEAPWKRQIDVLTIDADRDFISDRGEEIWNILEARGIDNVILTGVHTNMCVLGRPFGLRQMAAGGKHVVLMRDMTDTMYNPKAWPFVSHFTGTDLIIEHIEKFVCPTITSDQIIGDEPFVFRSDKRPHVVMMIGEQEYRTNESLPKFAAAQLGKDFRVSFVFADESDRNNFLGIEAVQDADVLLVSVRRRTPAPEQLEYVREHVAAGKPVIGIRTASHAFALRKGEPPAGLAAWPEFDAEVFGGHYTNHHGNKLKAAISIVAEQSDHPILVNLPDEPFIAGGSLYKTSPVNERAAVLMTGKVDDAPAEPVAWTFERNDGGRSFYTSLGHVDDFANPAFVQLLKNAITWAAEATLIPVASTIGIATPRRGWIPITIPASKEASEVSVASDPIADSFAPSRPVEPLAHPEWFRCFIALREPLIDSTVEPLLYDIECPLGCKTTDAWLNGQKLPPCSPSFGIKNEWLIPGLNTVVFRVKSVEGRRTFLQDGVNFRMGRAEVDDIVLQTTSLHGIWQHRIGDDPAWTDVPLPAQFAAPTDAIYEVK